MNEQPIVTHIWREKYRFGNESSPAESHARVAEFIYSKDTQEHKEEALKYLIDWGWSPGGRISAGAGTNRRVTLLNCFVSPTVEDSMEGIMKCLSVAAFTQQQGGGIGTDFSTIRPSGALVKRTGSISSGVLPFMDMWNSMCATVKSSGSRRGAMMGTLACWHPDILKFITAKQTPGRLTNFNVSVLITKDFMKAVKNNESWDLGFHVPPADESQIIETISISDPRNPTNLHTWKSLHPDYAPQPWYVYTRMPVVELWDMIIRNTYEYAEPGVMFIDRINEWNNLSYVEFMHCSNPCLPADAWAMTSEGPRQVQELIGKQFQAVVHSNSHAQTIWPSGSDGFFETGTKTLLKVETKKGYEIELTTNHKLKLGNGEWVEAGQLKVGDTLSLQPHANLTWSGEFDGCTDMTEGYLLGLLLGDGTIKDDVAVLSLWAGTPSSGGVDIIPGVQSVMDFAAELAARLPHRSDYNGWCHVKGYGQYRLKMKAITDIAHRNGMRRRAKTITPYMERRSSTFYQYFLCGLFDTDGSVQGIKAKSVTVRLSQSDLPLLKTVQRMLLRLGIASTIYQNRRLAQDRLMPDGKGGLALYKTKANHELAIATSNLKVFQSRIGFKDSAKAEKLATGLAGYVKDLQQEQFQADVSSITETRTVPVYDVSIPGINFLDISGLTAHNCGEQNLPPNGDCDLGAVNLATCVANPFTADAYVDIGRIAALTSVGMRFLDNVIDVAEYPTNDQAIEARKKRRTGLGILGLANMLQQLRIRYGSVQSLEVITEVMVLIRDIAYYTSTQLAKERGPFPAYDAEKFAKSKFFATLPAYVQKEIRLHGIRNGVLLTIAPTGTTAIYAGNVSSGLEPTFDWCSYRKVLANEKDEHGKDTFNEFAVEDYGFRLYLDKFIPPAEHDSFRKQVIAGIAKLPDYMVTAMELTVAEHLDVQAVCQKYIDASISKTINCPASMSYEDFKSVYMRAYESGLKGCTTYRPSSVRGSVLSKESQLTPKEVTTPTPTPTPITPTTSTPTHHLEPLTPRPAQLHSTTYKRKWPQNDAAYYITISDLEEDGIRRPFEIFINSRTVAHLEWTTALTRTISSIFRMKRDVNFLIEELEQVYSPTGGAFVGGKHVPSLVALIGLVIKQHIEALNMGESVSDIRTTMESAPIVNVPITQSSDQALGDICEKCNRPTLYHMEGCKKCSSCGFSTCG